MQSWIGNESHRRDPVNVNFIPIALVPDYELKDKTDGYVLAISKLKFIQIDGHFIAVKNNKIQGENINREIANNILRQYHEYSWNSYDQYIAFQHNVSVITPDRRCNCYDFGRRFKCAHTECIKIVVDKEAIPEDAHNIKLHGRRKSGRPAKAKGKYVIQDYAMNVADPEEGDGYDMDDDANDYDDDARGQSFAVSGGDSSSCSSSSSASTVNSSDAMAGRSSGTSPSTNAMAGRCSGTSSSANTMAGRTSSPSPNADAIAGQGSGPSSIADAKEGRTSGPSASANAMAGRSSGPSSSANAMFGRTSGPSASANAMFGCSSGPLPSADAKRGQGSAPRQSPTTSATFSRPAAHSSLYSESVTRQQPEKRCADVNQRGQSLKKQRS
jgi:hypothetical protein